MIPIVCEAFMGQDFYKLRDQCIQNGVDFVDDRFPLESQRYTWRRPFDICDDPKFFVNGVSRFDVNQGKLGNCYFLAAMANLTMHEKLFDFVVPEDNSNFDVDYCGIFHFRFWYFGKFVDVVVDDRLPTSRRKLVYAKSTDDNEFWSALLEKAYAKLYGGYEEIEGGWGHEAFEDFSGGLVENYNLRYELPPNLFEFIRKSMAKNAFFSCGILNKNNLRKTGLVNGHAYSITSAISIQINSEERVDLLRIRNPWGNEVEWTGAWSDKSYEWQSIPHTKKARIGLVIEDDGEFWMSFHDFRKYFDTLDICNLHPNIQMNEPHPSRKWNLKSFEGNFLSNMRGISVTLEDPDKDDDEDFCTVVIALTQKNIRRRNSRGRSENEQVGFKIHSLDRKNSPILKTSRSEYAFRGICNRYQLPPGRYFIEPFQFDTRSDGEYLLRVFYETKIEEPMYLNIYPSLPVHEKSLPKDSNFDDVTQRVTHETKAKLKCHSTKQPRSLKKKSTSCCILM